MGAKLVELVLLTWVIIGSIIAANFIVMKLVMTKWFMRSFMKQYTDEIVNAMEELAPKD